MRRYQFLVQFLVRNKNRQITVQNHLLIISLPFPTYYLDPLLSTVARLSCFFFFTNPLM